MGDENDASEVKVTKSLMDETVKELIDNAVALADEEVWDLNIFESEDSVDTLAITDAYSWFTRLSLTEFGQIDEKLTKAYNYIKGSGFEIISNQGAASTDGWNGKAAVQYRDMFAKPFETAASNQGYLLAALQKFLETMRDLHISGRQDAYTIAKNTIAQLKTAREEESVDWAETLSVVAFAAALTAAVLFPPSVAASSPLLVGATLSITGASAAAGVVKAADSSISGATMVEIMQSMHGELKRIKGYVEDQEIEIANAIDAAVESVSDMIRNKGDGDTDLGECRFIYPIRPAMIKDNDLDDVQI